MATYVKQQDVESDVEDNLEARKMMREIFTNTARWPQGFKGFSADIMVNISGKEESGTVTVKGPKEIELSIQDEKLKEFAADNLASIAMHRGPRSFEESDGKYKLHFGDEPNHPLGKSIIMGGDGMGSFYRVKEGRIRQINRNTPRFSFSINIEESVKTEDDKFLTSKYTVYYLNPETNAIKDVESYTDRYTRVGQADLPEYRRVINCEEGSIQVCSMTISKHNLL